MFSRFFKTTNKIDDYYRCGGLDTHRLPLGTKSCPRHRIKAEQLDDLVWDSLKNLLLTPQTIKMDE